MLSVAGDGYEVLGPVPLPDDPLSMANEWSPDEVVVGDVAANAAVSYGELTSINSDTAAVAIRVIVDKPASIT